MKMKIWCYAIYVIMISFLFLFPLVAADNDSMKILITLDREGTYSGGDTGRVTVHVFDKGSYVNPDNKPNCILGDSKYYIEFERDIHLTKESTGRYDGSFTIQDSDADEFNSLFLETKATYGKSDMEDTEYNTDDIYEYIYLEKQEDENSIVEVKIKNAPPSAFPGDSITFCIEVRKDNILTNADKLDINYEIDFNISDDIELELPYNNLETGVYEIVLNVSDTITESCEIKLEVLANIDNYYDFISRHIDVDFFSVWYHQDTIGETNAKFDIYVSDSQGKAVSEAEVSLTWEKDRRSLNETIRLTDGSGKAAFVIRYDHDTTELELNGKVEANGTIQDFSGEIMIRDEKDDIELDDPSPHGLDVIIKNRTISGSPPYTLDCIAYLNGQRISNKGICSYLYTKTEVIAYGAPITDINGEFKMTFSRWGSDTKFITAEFEAVSGDYYSNLISDRNFSLDGKEYASDQDMIWIELNDTMNVDFTESLIKIEADVVNPGELTEVTVGGILGRGNPIVTWIPAPVRSKRDVEKWEEYSEWSIWGGEGLMVQDMLFSDIEISCKLMIPEFLPSGEYTILGGYLDDSDVSDPDWSLETNYHLNSLVIMTGESRSTSPGPTEPASGGMGLMILIIFIIVLLLVIILAIVIMLIRRKKNQENMLALWKNDNQEPKSDVPPPSPETTSGEEREQIQSLSQSQQDRGGYSEDSLPRPPWLKPKDSSPGTLPTGSPGSMDRKDGRNQRFPPPPYAAGTATAPSKQQDETVQPTSSRFGIDDEGENHRTSLGHFQERRPDSPPPHSSYPPPPSRRREYPPPY